MTVILLLLWAPTFGAQVPERGYSAGYIPNDDITPMRDWSEDIPAHISVVDGRAWHDRDGDVEPAEQNVPLLSGDRIRTERGRVDVLFSDGSALDLDEGTDVEFLSESLIRLNTGVIRLNLVRSSTSVDYRIDSGGTSTWIRSAGDFRIATRGPGSEVRLTVFRGLAELSSPFGRSLVQTGSEAVATDRSTPSLPYAVNTSVWDPFDRWVQARADERLGDRYASSAQYLPEEIRYYNGTLSRYGAWETHPTDGYVWYPRVVADWRPYYDGRWSFVGSFGWFWVGATNWSWPTHHYGRWGTHYGRWYWIPERRWGPAWVSWASAPGYVSWCPLGYNNRPIYAFSATSYDAWRGWTVLPSRSFGTNVYVRRAAINGRTTLPRDARFVEREQAPVRPASFRGNQAPLRSPSSYARTRSAQPRDGQLLTDRQNAPSNRATLGVAVSDRTITTRRQGGSAPSERPSRPTMERGTAGSTARAVGAVSEPAEGPATRATARTRQPTVDRARTDSPDDGAAGLGSSARAATRRAPSADRNTVVRVPDQPRSSAPERAVENRTSPRPQRMEPRSAAPEPPPQAGRSSRVERAGSAGRPTAPPTSSGGRSGGEGGVRSRGGDAVGSSAPAPSAGSGRQAPSGAPSGGSAHARSR